MNGSQEVQLFESAPNANQHISTKRGNQKAKRGKMKKGLIIVLTLMIALYAMDVSADKAEEPMVICPSLTKVVIRHADVNNIFIAWHCASSVRVLQGGVFEYTPIDITHKPKVKPHYLSGGIITATHVDDMF